MINLKWQEENNLFEVGGYEIWTTRHAGSIIKRDFPIAFSDLKEILDWFSISKNEIISPGGGETTITQRLRKQFSKNYSWEKKNIKSKHIIDDKVQFSESHEIDHYKNFKKGSIGLEIEWNNKDPFFDRDLVSFRSLHSLNAISIGIIITRGVSLQEELHEVFIRHYSKLEPFRLSDLNVTQPQYNAIEKSFNRNGDLTKSVSKKLYNDKYGEATTHLKKLEARINRGLGNPCPLILIGIGKERLKEK